MRIMIFLDLDNFKQGLFIRDRNRFYDFGKFQYFILRFIKKNLSYISVNEESLIRTYAYTGEYSQRIIGKINDDIKKAEIIKRADAQKKFFEIAKNFNLFEIKTLPLKYEDNKIVQKGIDVLLSTDIICNAFKDNYDLLILSSGDIDLVESVKVVKGLGKRVIVFSHKDICSKELQREADFFINIAKLKEEELNDFSRIKEQSM